MFAVGSPSDPSQTAVTEAKPNHVYSILKTTWAEFQKASQTATEQGKAKLRILDFKNTWPEF